MSTNLNETKVLIISCLFIKNGSVNLFRSNIDKILRNIFYFFTITMQFNAV